jgi:hypothetical protein
MDMIGSYFVLQIEGPSNIIIQQDSAPQCFGNIVQQSFNCQYPDNGWLEDKKFVGLPNHPLLVHPLLWSYEL